MADSQSFSLYFHQITIGSEILNDTMVCWWDLNWGPLVLEVTTQPIEPEPQRKNRLGQKRQPAPGIWALSDINPQIGALGSKALGSSAEVLSGQRWHWAAVQCGRSGMEQQCHRGLWMFVCTNCSRYDLARSKFFRTWRAAVTWPSRCSGATWAPTGPGSKFS